jgi:hypothetical protein
LYFVAQNTFACRLDAAVTESTPKIFSCLCFLRHMRAEIAQRADVARNALHQRVVVFAGRVIRTAAAFFAVDFIVK